MQRRKARQEREKTLRLGVMLFFFICAILRPVRGKKCRFCDCRDARATCDWPTMWRGEVLVEHLQVGDIWIAQQSEQRAERRGTIVEIEDFDLTRRFWISIPAIKEPRPYDRFRGERQLSERIQTCDNPCCFRHRRRIGGGRYYCFDHWSAWEAVS